MVTIVQSAERDLNGEAIRAEYFMQAIRPRTVAIGATVGTIAGAALSEIVSHPSLSAVFETAAVGCVAGALIASASVYHAGVLKARMAGRHPS